MKLDAFSISHPPLTSTNLAVLGSGGGVGGVGVNQQSLTTAGKSKHHHYYHHHHHHYHHHIDSLYNKTNGSGGLITTTTKMSLGGAVSNPNVEYNNNNNNNNSNNDNDETNNDVSGDLYQDQFDRDRPFSPAVSVVSDYNGSGNNSCNGGGGGGGGGAVMRSKTVSVFTSLYDQGRNFGMGVFFCYHFLFVCLFAF